MQASFTDPTLPPPPPPAGAQIKLPIALPIAHIAQDNYRTKTLTLDGELDGRPGQFVMAWLPRFDEKPFSLVHASPITLMITAVGPFTRLVHALDVGDRLWVRGAYGRGFGAPGPGKRVALIAGGYGVAPLYWLARTIIEPALPLANAGPSTVTAILGARNSRDLLYTDRFSQLLSSQASSQAEAGHNLLTTTDDGSAGIQGQVTTALGPLLQRQEIDAVYGCGPDPMLAAVGALCNTYGVPAQLSWEAYMRCGVGLCGSCEHGGRLLCLDGPVLPG